MAIFTNQATLSYRNNIVNSNVVTGQILEVLSATKDALPSTYYAGEVITYIINLFNTGGTTLSGVTVTDDLGAYTFGTQTLVPLSYVEGSLRYYVNGVQAAAPTPTATSPLTVSGLTLPAGGNGTLIYQTTVNQYAPLAPDATITNTATVSGNGACEGVTVNETITVRNAPALAITKAVSPSTVVDNGQLTYTFTIQNYGNTATVATDNLTVTDTFDPVLDPITVTYNGQTLTEGQDYTYDAATGAFATVAGAIVVPAATYAQDPQTGEQIITPGIAEITVSGTVQAC